MKLRNVLGIAVLLGAVALVLGSAKSRDQQTPSTNATPTSPVFARSRAATISPIDGTASRIAVGPETDPITLSSQIQLVQYLEGGGSHASCTACQQSPAGGCGNCAQSRHVGSYGHSVQPSIQQAPGAVRSMLGVNEFVGRSIGREPTFRDSQLVPWEMFSYGEYIGPHRTPHVPEYRLRVNDSLEFVYFLNLKQSSTPYQIFVGDTLQISSVTDDTIRQPQTLVLSDGTISLPLIGQVQAAGMTIEGLQNELNAQFKKFLTQPSILVQIVEGDTPLRNIRDAVDARQGTGGQVRQAIVSPDGTVQLPVIGSVPAVGLTLDEIRREVNARYRENVNGLEVTPVLVQRAARFIYVVGQVGQPGRFELVGPTTVMQAIALAEGDLQGGNLRNIIVFRRDEQWRLTATRLDLSGAIHGRRPYPSDEIFLRDSDIVLIPRKPIQRLSEAVDLYLTRTLYSIFPEEIVFDFEDSGLIN